VFQNTHTPCSTFKFVEQQRFDVSHNNDKSLIVFKYFFLHFRVLKNESRFFVSSTARVTRVLGPSLFFHEVQIFCRSEHVAGRLIFYARISWI